MTSDQHQTGSDRIVEVAQNNGWSDDTIIVNLQGDEPLMPAVNLNQVAEILSAADCEMSTLYKNISKQEALNPDQVKLVTDCKGRALYFSRSVIPFDRDNQGSVFFGHIGLYAYRRAALEKFVTMAPSMLELREKLEQLRAIEAGMRIDVSIVDTVPLGVDTGEDLERARQWFQHSV